MSDLTVVAKAGPLDGLRDEQVRRQWNGLRLGYWTFGLDLLIEAVCVGAGNK